MACEEAQWVNLAHKYFEVTINVFRENLASGMNGRCDDNILANNVYQ